MTGVPSPLSPCLHNNESVCFVALCLHGSKQKYTGKKKNVLEVRGQAILLFVCFFASQMASDPLATYLLHNNEVVCFVVLCGHTPFMAFLLRRSAPIAPRSDRRGILQAALRCLRQFRPHCPLSEHRLFIFTVSIKGRNSADLPQIPPPPIPLCMRTRRAIFGRGFFWFFSRKYRLRQICFE